MGLGWSTQGVQSEQCYLCSPPPGVWEGWGWGVGKSSTLVVCSATRRHWVGCVSACSPERQSASITLLEMCACCAPYTCAKMREAPCWQTALVFIQRYHWQLLLCVLHLPLDTVSRRAGRYSFSICAVCAALCLKEPPDPDTAMVPFSLDPHSRTVAHVQPFSSAQHYRQLCQAALLWWGLFWAHFQLDTSFNCFTLVQREGLCRC